MIATLKSWLSTMLWGVAFGSPLIMVITIVGLFDVP